MCLTIWIYFKNNLITTNFLRIEQGLQRLLKVKFVLVSWIFFLNYCIKINKNKINL